MAEDQSLDQQTEQEPSPYTPEDSEPAVPEQVDAGQQETQSEFPASTFPRVNEPGEGNGGPLGCCMGVTIGLLLSMLLALAIFGNLTAVVVNGTRHIELSAVLRVAIALFSVAGVIAGGIIGWRIGKKVYREYEPPVLQNRRRKTRTTRR